MSIRRRFTSIWSSIALLIFISDLLFDIRIFSFSGFMVAIFMWITGGIIATILFGPKASKKSRRKPYSQQKSTTHSGINRSKQYCIACGSSFSIDAQYCPECGTTSLNATNKSNNKN